MEITTIHTDSPTQKESQAQYHTPPIVGENSVVLNHA
jgi:hypothetical protein